MDNPDKQNKFRFTITEGILLALAPPFSYFLAFSYESGFAQHFDIPINFIQVGFIDVIIFASVVFGGIVFFIVMINPIVMFFPLKKVFLLVPLSSTALVIFIISFFLFGYSNWKYWFFSLLFLMFYVFLDFGMPLFSQRNVSGYMNKWVAQKEHEQKINESNPDFFILIGRHYGGRLLFIIIGLMVSVLIVTNSGLAKAVNQDEFLVLDTSPEMVILRIYGDRMIVAPFNRKTQEVESKFIIKTLGEDDNLVISPEDIGPLKLKPTLTPTPLPTSTFTPSPTATAIPTSTNTPVP